MDAIMLDADITAVVRAGTELRTDRRFACTLERHAAGT